MFRLVNNLNGLTTPIVSMTLRTFSFSPSAPPVSSFRPKLIETPTPISPQRSLPPEFSPTLSAPLSSRNVFNASTLLASSSSSCGKSPLSRITPGESSFPTSSRRGIHFSKPSPSTPPGQFGDEASSFQRTSPSSPNSTLESVIAGASKHLHDRLLREPRLPSTRELRATTVAQRRAQQLCQARLPLNVTAFFAPQKSKNRNRTKHF